MAVRLPRDTDDLRGLRSASWIRESTGGQFDRYGPDSQREQIERAVDRYGLVPTGLEWVVAHSGRTVYQAPAMRSMIESAVAGEFDVLVVGYGDRWQRNLRETLNVLDLRLHPAGVAVLFADRRILSSDPRDWDELVSEAHQAERYSRRLSERIVDGYASKFARLADPGGRPPLGFHRVAVGTTGREQYVVRPDPATIGQAVALFERYAAGALSVRDLADEAGMSDRTLNDILRNPLYNGWVVRKGSDPVPASWRSNPPVSDALWERVQSLMARRTRGGGPRVPGRVDMLKGLIRCACGANVAAQGMIGGKHRRVHRPRCDRWVGPRYVASADFEAVIAEQVRTIRHDDATIAAVVSALGRPDGAPTLSLDASRVRKRKRDLALDHAAGRLTDEEYMAAVAQARLDEASVTDQRVDVVDPAAAVAYLRDMPRLWAAMTEAERAELVASVYAEIVVTGRDRFESVRLTPAAYAHGLALAMRETVRVDKEGARPTGVARGRSLSVRVPIEGRAEWRAAARRSA